ncbi:MAG: SDR family NAD(P)-dependent oxidoreductase [Bacteroidales bacterium]|jgi:short-subunit dehydrogenase|nr:SDR family NAD(P)-dependent oxidoreductase [Bacteroidales bacterium]MDX9907076.1 SDR family NAD(P)-dependent oxidoreductase [Bacteroidales bacterium]
MLDSDCDWTLITGATTDMGYEMARLLAAKGENLVLVCKDENRLCHMARELNEVSDIIIMPVDLSKKNSLYLIADECERLGLRIGALFNFA